MAQDQGGRCLLVFLFSQRLLQALCTCVSTQGNVFLHISETLPFPTWCRLKWKLVFCVPSSPSGSQTLSCFSMCSYTQRFFLHLSGPKLSLSKWKVIEFIVNLKQLVCFHCKVVRNSFYWMTVRGEVKGLRFKGSEKFWNIYSGEWQID